MCDNVRDLSKDIVLRVDGLCVDLKKTTNCKHNLKIGTINRNGTYLNVYCGVNHKDIIFDSVGKIVYKVDYDDVIIRGDLYEAFIDFKNTILAENEDIVKNYNFIRDGLNKIVIDE